MGAYLDLTQLKGLRIGVKRIDDEHMAMAAVMEKINTAMVDQDHDHCVALLNELIQLAAAHFEDEEAFLAEVAYPGLAEHQVFHNEMLLKAKAVREVCEAYHDFDHIRACYQEMLTFLIDDILKGDVTFKSFLEENGLCDAVG
ncbi:MAG: bacteriohemerythrin [Rhodospirillales bacterium]